MALIDVQVVCGDRRYLVMAPSSPYFQARPYRHETAGPPKETGSSVTSSRMEDAHAARANEQAHDDEDDAPQQLFPEDRKDA